MRKGRLSRGMFVCVREREERHKWATWENASDIGKLLGIATYGYMYVHACMCVDGRTRPSSLLQRNGEGYLLRLIPEWHSTTLHRTATHCNRRRGIPFKFLSGYIFIACDRDGKLVDDFSHASNVTSLQDLFTSRPQKTPFYFTVVFHVKSE